MYVDTKNPFPSCERVPQFHLITMYTCMYSMSPVLSHRGLADRDFHNPTRSCHLSLARILPTWESPLSIPGNHPHQFLGIGLRHRWWLLRANRKLGSWSLPVLGAAHRGIFTVLFFFFFFLFSPRVSSISPYVHYFAWGLGRMEGHAELKMHACPDRTTPASQGDNDYDPTTHALFLGLLDMRESACPWGI
jgi:hypothetical protein